MKKLMQIIVASVVGAAVLFGVVACNTGSKQAYTFPHRLYDHRPMDERITIEVLQGIVNRDAPRLFFTETWTPYNQQWTNVYAENYGIEFEPIEDSIPTLIKTFRGALNGAVLYNPEVDGSRFIAAMVGGLENLLPVAKGSAWFEDVDLPVKHDFSNTFTNSIQAYEWALKELMPRCNRTLAHAPASLGVDGKYIGWGFLGIDYVISERGFVFNLGCIDEDMEAFGRIIEETPDQKKMYKRILDELEAPALVLGYGEPELEFFHLIGEHGHTYLHWGDNLSFHARVKPHNKEFRQKKHITPEQVVVDKDKYYVTFVSSEGDSMKGPLPFFFGSWFDPARGSVPVNWGIHPEMVRFPAVLEYYYDTATTNDYFMAVQVPNYDMKRVNEFARHFRDRMKKADLKTMTADFAAPTTAFEKKKAFMDIVNPLGWVDCLFEKSTLQGYNRFTEEKQIPFVGTSMHLTYWYRLLSGGWRANWQDMYKDPESREQVLKAVLDEIGKEAAAHEPPYLIVVYSDMHAFDKFCELHREVAKRLDTEKYKVVRIDEAFSAMRKWKRN